MTPRLFAVSASTPAGLERETQDLIARLEGGSPEEDRPASAHRRCVVARTPAEAADRMRRGDPREVFTAEAERGRPVVFMFAGVGDQYPGMASGLYRRLPCFRRELDRCLRLLRPDLGTDPHEVLYPGRTGDEPRGAPDLAALFDRRGSDQEIHRTLVAQPLAFATQYALGRSLLDIGVTPTALLGYSVGEYVAACLAGVLPLDSALRLVARRARLVDGLPEGAMLAVLSPPAPLAPHVRDGVSIAARDGPGLTILAGPPEALEQAARDITGQGVACRRLATAHAFHSPMMDPVVAPLREALAAIPLRAPSIPMLSNVTGTWLGDDEATDPAYWAGHLRRPIRFDAVLAEIAGLGRPITVELGPGRTLTNLATHDGLKLRSLPGIFESHTDLEIFLTTVGRLWTTGADIDWAELGSVT